MKIVRVTSAALREQFIDLPWQLYRHDPSWVPPLRSEMRAMMDPRQNPFHAHALVEHFLALGADGQAAGRIAACIYPVDVGVPRTDRASFGFFESIEDVEVARALLGAAEEWARTHSMRHLSGPFNYCSTQEMGLLTGGFASRPTIYQTHNLPYYAKLLERCGYSCEMTLSAYACDIAKTMPRAEPLLAQGEEIKRRLNLTARPLDPRQFHRDMEVIRQLYNASMSHHEGIVPIYQDIYEWQVRRLKPFIDPHIIRIIEQDGKAVAFALLLPDLNELLLPLDGRLRLWDFLTLRSKLQRIQGVVVLVVGAVPELHGAGLGRVITAEIFSALRDRPYRRLHTTWIFQGNRASRALVQRFQFDRTREYAILGRALPTVAWETCGSAGAQTMEEREQHPHVALH